MKIIRRDSVGGGTRSLTKEQTFLVPQIFIGFPWKWLVQEDLH